MVRLSSHRAALAGIALTAAAAGAALLSGAASAQTPPPPPPNGGVNCGIEVKPISAEEIAQMRAKLAAQLAQALGKPQAEVQRALEQVDNELQANRGDVTARSKPAAGVIAVRAPLDDIAERLGVTVQELEEAMKASAPAPEMIQCEGAPDGQAGQAIFTRAAVEPPFAEIARRLGRGITAEQVRAAFEASRPVVSGGGPNTTIIADSGNVTIAFGGSDEFVEALARALDVSVEQIRAAFQSISVPAIGLPPVPTPR